MFPFRRIMKIGCLQFFLVNCISLIIPFGCGAESLVLSVEPTASATAKPVQMTLAQLNEEIEKLRSAVKDNYESKEIRYALSKLLTDKVNALHGKPLEELEPLLQEAIDLVPESFVAHYLWGFELFARRNFEAAIPHFEAASNVQPDHLDCIMKLGICFMNSLKYEDAITQFDKAYKIIPKDFFLLYSLGKCRFEVKDFEKAVEAWEEALKVAPSAQDAQAIQQLIQKAKEHDASIAGTTKDENQRFIVHYAGNSQKDIGEITMEMLEDVYDQVTLDLMYKPEIQINVIFFLTDEFYELNKTGKWVGALTQGVKILVPLRQGYSDPTSIKGILAHEFTHVIVNLRTNARCPTFINEGLAVYEEFKSAYGDPNTLRPDYERVFQQKILNEKSFIPLKQINLDPSQQTHGAQIPHGYLESYLSMRFLIERWGMQGIDQLLGSLGKGNYLDDALEESTSMNAAQFQKEFFDWMLGL